MLSFQMLVTLNILANVVLLSYTSVLPSIANLYIQVGTRLSFVLQKSNKRESHPSVLLAA